MLEVGFSEKRKPSRFKLFYEQAPWKGMEEVRHPEIEEWLLSWREYVEKLLREPIAPQNIRFFAGASSTKEILDQPAAFAVYNDVGIPVLLIPPNWAGALRIPLANSSVAEIRAVAGKLGAIGVDDLSMLAALWPQIVADAIETDRRLAAALIADARSEIEELDSKGAFGILDKEAEEKFKTRGFSNDASLANMKYEEATTIAGGYTLALKLIQSARNRIPESAWKLDALGFSSPQMDKLFELGVETQGDWVNLTGDAAGRKKAAAELGVDDDFIDASRQTTAANQTGAVAEKVTLPGIDSVAGVNRAVAAALIKAGISTVDELAASKADELAPKIGISEPQAALIIKDAKTKTSGSQPIEKLKFAQDIQKQLKELEIHTVDDLLKASITKLTKVFGDKAKAQGVKDGVGRVFGPKR
jgi:hypothetical protein